MGSSRSVSSTIIIIAMVLPLVAHTGYATNDTNHSYRREFLAAHNAERSKVGVWPMVWNETVEAYAKEYTKIRSADCNAVHSVGPYGENIVVISVPLSPAVATKYWVDEKKYYNYDENVCIGGRECRHYTQLVWRYSTQLGCATTTCKNNGWTFVTCNYWPAGNYEFEWPY